MYGVRACKLTLEDPHPTLSRKRERGKSAREVARVDEVGERLARARRLAGAQLVVERRGVADPADDRGRLDAEAVRHLELGARAVELDARHAVGMIAEHRRL